MNRTSPPTDVVTLIGMVATIAGILVCLFFLFTPVTFGAVETDTRTDGSPDLQIAMRWIQPILGQAIVEDALIRYRSNFFRITPVVDGLELLHGIRHDPCDAKAGAERSHRDPSHEYPRPHLRRPQRHAATRFPV